MIRNHIVTILGPTRLSPNEPNLNDLFMTRLRSWDKRLIPLRPRLKRAMSSLVLIEYEKKLMLRVQSRSVS